MDELTLKVWGLPDYGNHVVFCLEFAAVPLVCCGGARWQYRPALILQATGMNSGMTRGQLNYRAALCVQVEK